MKKIYIYLLLFSVATVITCCSKKENVRNISIPDSNQFLKTDSVKKDVILLIETFLGNSERNYYGNVAPEKLDLIWKHNLGGGRSNMPHSSDLMYGAGWTGQPLLISENNKKYIFQGALDHHLKKIDAETGELIWQYKFDDVIKATGSLYYNPNLKIPENKLVVLQGSRQGYGMSMGSKYIWSFRGISGISGDELFRINVKRTESVSRDVDGSACVVNDTAYIGFENGMLNIFNPNPEFSEKPGDYNIPQIYNEIKLYEKSDVGKHRGNIINEASPCKLGNKLFIAAGSGHVYGYNLLTKEIDWDFYIGSDLNGSCVATFDSCILVPVEKQYIAGKGGVLKLDPRKSEKDAVVWYFATGNRTVSDWEGGVIGSPAVNDKYIKSEQSHYATFIGMDGWVYVVEHTKIDSAEIEIGFDGKSKYDKPKLIYKYNVGSSISSPIILENKLVACSYSGIYLFEYDNAGNFKFLERRGGCFEATPIAYDKRIYIGGKDGYLYCLGEK